MNTRTRSLIAAALLVSGIPALAHEAWILPFHFHQMQSPKTQAHIQVGQQYKGNSQLYNPDKFERLEVVRNGVATRIKGRIGDLPAISHELSEPGLHVLLYQSTGNVISYENWEKFENFTNKEGVSWAQKEHLARGYPREDFDEIFIRYAKSLITWQNPAGSDGRNGMPFEIVALNNPYLDTDTLNVEVLWQGAPYADSQLAVFSKKPGQEAQRIDLQTDAAGKVGIPIAPGTGYLLNSVYMEPLEFRKNTPLWRSHWASMTLQLPSD